MPGVPVAFGIGRMRRILPFGLLVFADVRWASQTCAAGPLVGRVEAVRERVGVVARGDVEVAVGAPLQRAAGVAALLRWCCQV